MSNIVPTARYYPKLSEVVTVENLPEFLSFVQDGVNAIFDKIHYKNLQYSKSKNGDSAFYSLEIVSRRLKIELPFDMALQLNPDLTGHDATISSFPITLEYQWEILAFLKSFDLNGFSFSLDDFYSLGLKVFRITEDQVLAHVINYFVEPVDQDTTKFEQFVTDFNAFKELNYPDVNDLELPAEPSVASITQGINGLGIVDKNVSMLLFGLYILDTDLEVTKTKLQQFYNVIVPEGIEAYIKKIIIPKAKASLALSAAIEFPPKVLKPVNGNGSTDGILPDAKVSFVFAEAQLYVDTEAGIGYQLELGGSLLPTGYAEIGKTGILLQIDSLKLDLSKKTNIPEADADGRSNDFVGVYARALSITLPSKWFHDETEPVGATATTLRIGAYDLLVGSGGISGTIMLETIPMVTSGSGFNYFNTEFDFVYPISLAEEDATTHVIKDKVLHNYEELIAYLQLLNTSNANKPYPFKFPLSLLPVGTTSVLKFDGPKDYQSYLKSLADDGTILWKRLGASDGFRVGFKKFDIAFKQNVVVSSNIEGRLRIAKLKDATNNPSEIIVLGHIQESGDFQLIASEPDGISCNLFDVLTLTFQSIELGKEHDVFYIGADTKISFPETSLAYTLFKGQAIDVPAIRYYVDGRFEIAGGNAFIPVNFTLPIGPIEMSVTGIHFGSVQREYSGKMRKYNYIGFDGGLSIDPIGIDVRGKGVKYYYTIDDDEAPDNSNDSYFHISTLDLDLIIPGSAKPKDAIAIIKGSLTIPDPGISTEYKGKVTLQLPRANIYGEASMSLNPKYPSYLINASVEFPVPIPLGPVGIFGFRGLIGYRYVAEKKAIGMVETDSWYEYYMAPQRGIHTDKFSGPEQTKDYDSAFSVGIGATIATMDGGGRTASLRAMLLLSLPSMFAIDAGLTILSERLGLAEDDPTNPPFYAFIIIGDDALELGAGANFQINKSEGYLLEIRAQIQAGFYFKNQKPWYINFGTREKPITATLFRTVLNVRAYSYLMIAASGIEAGARVSFDFDLFIATLHASLEVGGFISFERPQIGGYIKAEGAMKIDFWIFDLTAFVGTYFSVELPKPFLIYAEIKLRVCARIKLGFIKIKICLPLHFKLKWQKNNTIIYTPIPPLTYLPVIDADYSKDIQTANFVKGVHMMTFETFELHFFGVNSGVPDHNLIDKIIPLDTYIDIKVEKGLNPSAISSLIGGHTGGAKGFVDLIPPRQQVPGGRTVRQVKHKYSIEQIEIKAWSDSSGHWVNYHPFKSVLPNNSSVDNLKVGFWQKNKDQYDTIRLLATNPFSFLDGAEPGWFIPEQYGITPSELFCTSSSVEEHCSNVLNKALGTVYNPPINNPSHYINNAYYNIKGFFEQVVDVDLGDITSQMYAFDKMTVTQAANPFGFAKSLEFKNVNTLVITLPESSPRVRLRLTTFAQGVTIRYYRTAINDASIFQAFELIEEVYKTQSELASVIEYDNTIDYNNLSNVFKIEITPDSPNIDEINSIQEQIEELLNSVDENSSGVTSVTLTGDDLALYNLLIGKLDDLKALGCNQGSPCQLDERLCELYAYLMNIYNDCFLTYPIKDIYNYCSKKDCFDNFIKAIQDFDTLFPQYHLISDHIAQQVNTYISQLSQLSEMCSSNNPDSSAALALYNSFVSNTLAMITVIGDLGNCNCTGAPVLNCTTSIQSVCWITLEEYEFNQTIPSQSAVQEDTNLMISGINTTAQPVWRPNTKYYIKFRLKDEVDNGLRTPGIFDYYYGFKTVGPVGHFHKYTGPGAYTIPAGSSINEYPLTSLAKYIDYNRSYPNADGSLLLAKPLFYGNEQCKIDLFFAKTFAYHLLNTWGAYNGLPEIKGAMHLAIKDPISDVIIPYPLPSDWSSDSVPETVGNGENGISWVNDEDPLIPNNIQILMNYVDLVNANSDAVECDINIGQPIKPASYTYSVSLSNLKPRKLYTALVYNAFDANGDQVIANHIDNMGNITYEESQKVHEFVFQTSRYANFREQVESFILKEYDDNGVVINQKQAVFDLPLDLTNQQVINAFALVSGGSNAETEAMKIQFYHDFDRIIEGVFGLKPIDPPTTTDFIKIKNNTSGDVVALIVRNPEPFNNPRMPFGIIQDTIQVMTGSNVNTDYKVLFSKDYSQVIIMHSSLVINSNIKLRFKYKVWNGSQYVIPNINPISGVIIDPTKDTGIVVIDNLELTN